MNFLNAPVFFGFYKLMYHTGNTELLSWRAAALTCQFQVLLLLNFLAFIEHNFNLNLILGDIYYYVTGIIFTLINLHCIFSNDNWRFFIRKYDALHLGYRIFLSIGSVAGTIVLFLLIFYQFSIR